MLKKKINIIVIMISMVMLMCGCDKVADEEKQELERRGNMAVEYYNEKYNVKETAVESTYDYVSGLSGRVYDTEDLMFFTMSDGKTVVYDIQNNRFLDNRQSEEISKAITEELSETFWKPLFEDIKSYTGFDVIVKNKDKIEYNVCILDDKRDCYYETYYDGDVVSFLDNEDIWASIDTYMIIQSDDESWRDAVEHMKEEFDSHFDGYSGEYIIVGTSALGEKYLAEEGNYYPVSGDEGYIAKVWFDWDIEESEK